VGRGGGERGEGRGERREERGREGRREGGTYSIRPNISGSSGILRGGTQLITFCTNSNLLAFPSKIFLVVRAFSTDNDATLTAVVPTVEGGKFYWGGEFPFFFPFFSFFSLSSSLSPLPSSDNDATLTAVVPTIEGGKFYWGTVSSLLLPSSPFFSLSSPLHSQRCHTDGSGADD
jgi:hypothetical protein